MEALRAYSLEQHSQALQVDLVEKVRVVVMYRGRGFKSKITPLKWWSVWS
jgi:hypothetical protein